MPRESVFPARRKRYPADTQAFRTESLIRGIPPGHRIPALDGIRGIAIAGVVLHHYFNLPFGWAGVDVFFVLSGFLITRILLDSRASANYYRCFYTKRAFRILPLYAILIAVFEALSTGGYPSLTSGRLSIWVYLVMGQAIAAAVCGCGIGEFIAVTWSLSLEEYFYLIFPIVVKKVAQRLLILTLLAIAAFSPLMRLVLGSVVNEVAGYLWRFDGIALGALTALICGRPDHITSLRRYAAPLAGASGAVVVAAAVAGGMRHSVFTFSVVPSAVSVLTAAVIAWVVTKPSNWHVSVLSIRPLTILGDLSYSLYLFHYGIRLVVRNPFLGIGVSLGIAALTWRFVEQPMMKLGRRIAATRREGSAANSRPQRTASDA